MGEPLLALLLRQPESMQRPNGGHSDPLSSVKAVFQDQTRGPVFVSIFSSTIAAV